MATLGQAKPLERDLQSHLHVPRTRRTRDYAELAVRQILRRRSPPRLLIPQIENVKPEICMDAFPELQSLHDGDVRPIGREHARSSNEARCVAEWIERWIGAALECTQAVEFVLVRIELLAGERRAPVVEQEIRPRSSGTKIVLERGIDDAHWITALRECVRAEVPTTGHVACPAVG